MKPTFSILLFLLFIFNSYCQVQPKIGSSEYAIIPLNTKEKYPVIKNAKAAELTRDEILQIEKIIKQFVAEKMSAHNKKLKKPDVYRRQYVAAINQNGEKEIWINFFCSNTFDSSWITQIARFGDGGDCYFHINVNLSKKTYYSYFENTSE